MNRTIRQQTAMRSQLVRTADGGMAKPVARLPRPRLKPRPLDFIIDGTACTDDALTACYPRTTRQAFGHYAADMAPARITFLRGPRGGWIGLLIAVAILAAFALA